MKPVGHWAHEELGALASRGLSRHLEPLSSAQGPEIELNGEERLVSFSSNDYLGLANDSELQAAAIIAAQRYGTGTGASRLVTGDSVSHRALEKAIAAFEGTEAALIFNSGYAANLGLLSTFCGAQDVIFSDALNHASIIDGARLSKAKVVIYPHRDVAALEVLLSKHNGRRALVVTDTIFSMDGDRAPLRELSALCEQTGAALMVDEAHATGVCGPTGAGLCEELGLAPEVRMGTLSKALGGFGAYAACSAEVRQWLINRARSLIYSTSLPPGVCAVATAAIARVRRDGPLRERLWKNIRFFAAGLRQLGLPAHEDSAIFPVVVGSPEAAINASRAMRTAGLLVKPIRPPTVPEGTSRLRFALCAAHTEEHLTRALDALASLEIRGSTETTRSPGHPDSSRGVTDDAAALRPSTALGTNGSGRPSTPLGDNMELPHAD
jgi:8-amino-7-oxononanoate synthase